ncbi:rhamnulokinase family protein [Halocella sp. SP3-1]|uniref:rhamnulokinase n=1 Tax=Halocella sp. SP3-1 TaxID=2382161 RepID=UPI000F74CC8B|nr:rhamnulokinase family protein [Halocella sp. SP3-1]AZO93791.1 rhamnulokinase [Halocella sp. SP3-1]
MSRAINLLACDLGASNGRALLARFDGNKLKLDVIHNFTNGGARLNGNFYWDILALFAEIKQGIKKAVKVTDDDIHSMGLDTWGVDYGLLDENGKLMSLPFHYRDSRTDGIPEEVFKKIAKKEIYQETGIQFMQINTIFQLYTEIKERPWILNNAATLLFMPDLLNYLLTGEKYNEYTIASTAQLFNPVKNTWSETIFKGLGIPVDIMQKIIYPGTRIGDLLPAVKKECGLNNDLPVMAVGSHDTASAVAATPLGDENSVYLSSGTWSLLGMELTEPVINEDSLKENFTNELGLEKKVRFLKNITGLWLIQECKRIWQREGKDLSYSEISEASAQATPFKYRLDPDDPVFMKPENMPEVIKEYCRKTKQAVPETIGEMARGIYESLAFSYDKVIKRLEKLVDRKIKNIHMVGGGIQAELLCQYTADISKRRVLAGPVEATATGNVLAQLIGLGEIKDLKEGRELVRNSIKLKEYLPA